MRTTIEFCPVTAVLAGWVAHFAVTRERQIALDLIAAHAYSTRARGKKALETLS
jgi:hypothetical protein